ncbi:MAG: hypothetical protein V4436_01750 [Patescibacteria group bacterium]
MDKDDKSGVDKLKDKLYSRKEIPQMEDVRTPLEAHENEVPVGWKDTSVVEEHKPINLSPVTKKTISLSTKIFIGSILFFIVASAVATLVFFGGGNLISPQNIDLQVVAPSLIDGGKASTFQIIATNRNQSDLVLVDMIIDYPEGTRSATDATKALTHERQTIGTIKSGEQIKRTVSGIFYGQEGAQQALKVTLEYSVVGSNAVFEKQTEAAFTIGSSPVSVTVESPSEAISGDSFSMNITVHSNAPTPINNVVLGGQYPFGFSVTGATPSADAGGTLWRLGTLEPGETQKIKLTGTIVGQDGDERIFRFSVGSNNDQTDTQIKVPFLSVPQTLTVHKPFVSGTISVEGQSGKTVTVTPGKALQGTVHWQNNLTDALSDVELVLTFSGPAIDKTAINSSNGFYQSSNNSIIWTKSQVPSLGNVPPGGSGDYQFSFASLPPGAGNVLITNPTISLNLQVRGSRQGGSGVPENIGSAASLQVTLSSAASITAQTFHFSGPFTNIGPMPPRAEAATTYTIVWTVKNASNALANTSVSTVLPPYVQFMSAISGEGVTYDAASRTVRWPVGELKAGVGYTLSSRQVAFQVTLVPSTSQVGQGVPLTGATTLAGQDRFAQVNVNSEAAAPTTKISGEAGFTSGMDIVAPKQ